MNIIKKLTKLFSSPRSSITPTREVNRTLCLEHVFKEPGLTAAEIAVAVGLERQEPSRRLPELRQHGLIRNGPIRHCTIQGTKCMTWIPLSSISSPLKGASV
ncbi:MAG: MarR family transcriptional regulator [Planctomycetes bacterium]|nr:MarR family transcriptional regulator [Planctomycetota bacterium]